MDQPITPRPRLVGSVVAHENASNSKAAGEVMPPKQSPHRPGILQALDLRAWWDVLI
jgi:hypothetical protein